jgi:hypothetical protein
MKEFTIEQLTKLAKFRAESYDTYLDDIYTSDKNQFTKQVLSFIDWLNSLNEYEINEILNK